MSKISLSPDASGTGIFTIASPNSNTNRTLTLPDDTGTIVTNSGNQAGSFTTLNTSGQVVFNDAGADVDFRVEGDTDANLLFVDASADAVGIGTNAPVSFASKTLEIYGSSSSTLKLTNATTGTGNTAGHEFESSGNDITIVNRTSSGYTRFFNNGSERMRLDSAGNLGLGVTPSAWDAGGKALEFSAGSIFSFGSGASGEFDYAYNAYFDGSWKYKASSSAASLYSIQPGVYKWFTAPSGTAGNAITFTQAMTLDASGVLMVGTTSPNPISSVVAGCTLGAQQGLAIFSRSNGDALAVQRLTNDGALVAFYQDGVVEGTISVSGNTVSYNPFLGSHSGALADWSKPDIKIGTVIDTIDELLEYKVVVIDVQEEVPAKDAVMDKDGNEVEPAQEATTQTVQKRISYNGNGAVGSSATVEYEGEEYTGTIQHEREEPLSFNKHLKVKVNDTAASKAVFGVFVGWNNDINNDGGVYNDMLVGAVGNYVIRMAAGQEPQIGDLVEADGNGCAVVQDDDIIRTKTIAKVTSTIKQVTYDDGSFLVTCVLYCG